ncbi:MAG: LuxR C-terminal-related transcriptional regulator [Anaerolineae bacterium]|nr:LuxR C-terminal-related transcriptional regulator [Anaerolineae bacterium]
MLQTDLPDRLTQREIDIARLMVAGLSAREISEELVLSYSTVRWYLKQIYGKLDAHSYEEAVDRIEAAQLLGAAKSHSRHNLPTPATTLIGREAELDDLTGELLQPESRLITLAGPGGIGKTRMALELARRNLPHFPDGAYFVPLQPLRSVEDIPAALIDALLIHRASGDDAVRFLLRYLENRQLLLVIDNFEHLMAGVHLLADILAAAPGVTILVTSREILNLQEEWVWQVGGLEVPANDAEASVDAYSAVQLFAERARQVTHDFLLADEQPQVVRICQLVGGMPLALELAASWVRHLSCDTIARQIAANVDFLVARASNIPARHHSIRAVFDHSWQLMSPEARHVFSKLSVFQGGFTYEAAEQVAGASPGTMAALVDQSLVRRHRSGRYDLHELVRQYGAEQLEHTGQTEAVRNAHSAYFAHLMLECGIDIKGRAQLAGLNAVGTDLDNFRAAWIWAADHRDYARIEQMIEGFYWYRNHRGRYNEVFQQAWDRLAPPPGEEPHPTALKIFARIHEYRHAPLPDIERAYESALQAEDGAEIAFCEVVLSFALADTFHDIPGAIQMLEDRLVHPNQEEEPFYAALRYAALAGAYDQAGQESESIRYAQESLERLRAIGNDILVAWANMGYSWNEERRPNELQEVLATFQEMDVPPGQVMTLCAMSRAAWIKKHDLTQAKQLAQRAYEIAVDINFVMGMAAALTTLSAWHSLEEDYTTARKLAQRSEPYAKDTIWQGAPSLAASMAACGLGDFEVVRQFFSQYGQFRYGPWDLDLVAALMAHDGYPEKAVELLARRSPNGLIYRTQGWPLLDRLRVDLQARLGAEAYLAAWERGASRDRDELVCELEAYFKTEVSRHE